VRLKSSIWVSAFLRRAMVEGLYGALIRKGAEEAGAVYVIVNHLDGTCHLFGPSPGASHDEEGERRWMIEVAPPQTPQDAMALLERRIRFDPDIWIVEVEDRTGTAGLVQAI
jgi:hypothetical protein